MTSDFIKKLNVEQLELVNKIEPNYMKKETDELFDILTAYFQEQGLEDIDEKPEQLLLESILDILGSM